ncbi:MAG: hypothetical protein K1X55_05605 [Chitinophagales bacterium]|nr:hypothetical protein [Chitinophagales bacterium]
MKKSVKIGLDFIIDKLTNSIENVVTGAMHVGGRIMIIDTIAALKLLNKYFPL